MGRPRSDLRCAVLSVASERLSLRGFVQRTGVEYRRVRAVVANCVREGELTYRLERAAHSKRPVAVYEPVLRPTGVGPCVGLSELMAVWR
jgi:hypothetical protein